MSLITLPDSFDQMRIAKLRHALASHPLMTVDSLSALALRIDPRFVRFHDGERQLATNMSEMLKTDPTRLSLRKALANLHKTKAFVQIINVRSDPEYREVVDAFLDEVTGALPPTQRELLNRDAAAFIASPASVTPFHLDHEQNFLCHISGKKTLWVWNHLDRQVVSERALEIFFREGTLRKVRYEESMQPRALEVALRPGDAVFMPMGSPHAVSTGDEISVTFSVLLNTKASMDLASSYRANHLLRRFGLSPAPVGTRPTLEAIQRNGLTWVRRVLELLMLRKRAPEALWY